MLSQLVVREASSICLLAHPWIRGRVLRIPGDAVTLGLSALHLITGRVSVMQTRL